MMECEICGNLADPSHDCPKCERIVCDDCWDGNMCCDCANIIDGGEQEVAIEKVLMTQEEIDALPEFPGY